MGRHSDPNQRDMYTVGRNTGWQQAAGQGEFLAEHATDPEERQGVEDGKTLHKHGYNADGSKIK